MLIIRFSCPKTLIFLNSCYPVIVLESIPNFYRSNFYSLRFFSEISLPIPSMTPLKTFVILGFFLAFPLDLIRKFLWKCYQRISHYKNFVGNSIRGCLDIFLYFSNFFSFENCIGNALSNLLGNAVGDSFANMCGFFSAIPLEFPTQNFFFFSWTVVLLEIAAEISLRMSYPLYFFFFKNVLDIFLIELASKHS